MNGVCLQSVPHALWWELNVCWPQNWGEDIKGEYYQNSFTYSFITSHSFTFSQPCLSNSCRLTHSASIVLSPTVTHFLLLSVTKITLLTLSRPFSRSLALVAEQKPVCVSHRNFKLVSLWLNRFDLFDEDLLRGWRIRIDQMVKNVRGIRKWL